MSRQHLELELLPEGVRVRDLGSRNGTFLGGLALHDAVLSENTVLRVGRVEVELLFEVEYLTGAEEEAAYGELVAASPVMRRLFGTLRRLEGSLITVLLAGESGTGKELIARAIHQHSVRAAQPLVTLNCGVLQRELARSELFGHRKGAFTGATDSRLGAFQRADGGTLFLDEVGELPLDVQPLLLRALQQREIVRVGDTEPERVDVRLIAATHRDLEQMVQEGTFREDLYYRLKVVHLEVPPLRTRVEDIPLLATTASSVFGLAHLPEEVLGQLQTYSWPGNVRELFHVVEAYAAIGQLPALRKRPLSSLNQVLQDYLDVTQPYEALKQHVLDVFQLAYLKQLMVHHGGNVSKAAAVAGLERSYLNKLVNQHGLR